MMKENPVLFGCLAVLGFGSLLACSGVLAMYFLADEIVEKAGEALESASAEMGAEAGLKDPMKIFRTMMAEGWSFNVKTGGADVLELEVVPSDDREINCEVLQELIFPHLAGTKETVVVRSKKRVEAGPGTVTWSDVECSWSGYPGRDPTPGDGEAPQEDVAPEVPTAPATEQR